MSEGQVANKISLVTGGGSGIGQATSQILAREGAHVVVADIDRSAASTVAEQIARDGGRAEALSLDVAQEAEWQAAMDRLLTRYSSLDVLVNCAGISNSKPIAESTYVEWRRVMSVNLDGVYLGTKHAIAAMTSGGSIINVSSVSGIKPSAGAAAYCASKAAIRIFSKTAAIECVDAQTGIRVNVVSPGGVITPMWDKEEFFRSLVERTGGKAQAFAAMAGDAPSQQFFMPQDIAETILYLASDASSHLTGTEIVLDRGYSG